MINASEVDVLHVPSFEFRSSVDPLVNRPVLKFPAFFPTTGASTVMEERTNITRTELQMALGFMDT